jgi:hypothetical protein
METELSSAATPPSEVQRIFRKLEDAKARYAVEARGGEMGLVTLPAHRAMIEAALLEHRDNAAIRSAAAVAFAVRAKLCTSLGGVPSLLPNGELDWWRPASCENLFFEDAVDLALELTVAAARDTLAAQHAAREAEQQAERERLETQRRLHQARVQAAKDARWGHLSPAAAAAFRLAAKHSGGVVGEVARALIAIETEPRRGEMQLPDDLDALLWRLTADKLTDEERQLVGLSRR